jgi:cell migration-inducing and hyaluronan-binding protein
LSFAPPPRPGAFTPGRPGTRPPGAPSLLANIGTPPPPQPPITLIHNGTEFKVPGNASNVRAGTEIEVKTERQVVDLSLSEMDQGSWVIFKLPGFTTAAAGAEQASLDALRHANVTSYFRDGNTLWVKLFVTDPVRMPVRPLDIQASVAVSRGQSVAAGTAPAAGANAVGKS